MHPVADEMQEDVLEMMRHPRAVVTFPETVAPEMPEVVNDLPAGARRLVQRAMGIAATVVNGEVLVRDGKHTGMLPRRLLRGPYARRGRL